MFDIYLSVSGIEPSLSAPLYGVFRMPLSKKGTGVKTLFQGDLHQKPVFKLSQLELGDF